MTLKGLIPKQTDFIPQTIGEHIKKRRLELGLTQQEAATRLGVTPFTVLHWETGATKTIPVKAMPGIIAFLGYDPFPKAETIGGQIKAYRRKTGLSLRQFADQLGVDASTIRNWEWGQVILLRAHRELVANFLDAGVEMLQRTMRKRCVVD
ncbi:MAG: helix-turn-helix domain-containing protein [Burkholderiales bacterium]